MTHRFLPGSVAAALLLMIPARAQTPDFSQLNDAFGIPIWTDENLWDDQDMAVAARLKWPMESKTSTDSSFRLYAGSKARVLGARPFSMVLYGADGKPDQISMVFANKGDSVGTDEYGRPIDYRKMIAADTRTIGEKLVALLGPPKIDKFGQGQGTSERVNRWDWNGHTILLAAPRGEYVAVRVIPTSQADQQTITRVSDADLRERLKERIVHRDNGDVILSDIPMVDQGPKGYCVPATFERALRYAGVPADMYVLAMAGQTTAGGGTSPVAMAGGANNLMRRYGRRLTTSGGRISTRSVARMIDQGKPILWEICVDEKMNKDVTLRSIARKKVTDWGAYLDSLKAARRSVRTLQTNPENGHICMIIGYNEKTNEIAVSDSWGPMFAERWFTVEEADAISQNRFMVVE